MNVKLYHAFYYLNHIYAIALAAGVVLQNTYQIAYFKLCNLRLLFGEVPSFDHAEYNVTCVRTYERSNVGVDITV